MLSSFPLSQVQPATAEVLLVFAPPVEEASLLQCSGCWKNSRLICWKMEAGLIRGSVLCLNLLLRLEEVVRYMM